MQRPVSTGVWCVFCVIVHVGVREWMVCVCVYSTYTCVVRELMLCIYIHMCAFGSLGFGYRVCVGECKCVHEEVCATHVYVEVCCVCVC